MHGVSKPVRSWTEAESVCLQEGGHLSAPTGTNVDQVDCFNQVAVTFPLYVGAHSLFDLESPRFRWTFLNNLPVPEDSVDIGKEQGNLCASWNDARNFAPVSCGVLNQSLSYLCTRNAQRNPYNLSIQCNSHTYLYVPFAHNASDATAQCSSLEMSLADLDKERNCTLELLGRTPPEVRDLNFFSLLRTPSVARNPPECNIVSTNNDGSANDGPECDRPHPAVCSSSKDFHLQH